MSGPKKEGDVIEIKRWDAVALWSWAGDQERCAICRNHIMQPCIECQANSGTQSGECTLAWGTCSHAFHFHCISRWIKTRQVCPLDNLPWDFDRIESSSSSPSIPSSSTLAPS